VRRLNGLDALRGVAACVVAFLFHSFVVQGPTFPWFSTYGYTAVDLFFVISGVVFSHVYLDGWQCNATLGQFARARIARLYPLHLLTLLAVVALKPGQPGLFLLNVAMLQGIRPESYNFPSWSLTVECACYAIFIAGALARKLKPVAFAAVIVGIVWSACPDQQVYRFGRGLTGFFVAVLLWQYYRRQAPAWFLAGLAAIVLATGFRLPLINYGASLSLTAWPLLVFAALKVNLEGQPWKWLGERSYSIYLLHVPAYMIAGQWLPGVALTLALAHFVYLYVERPARHWLKYIEVRAPHSIRSGR
jgi:peptidoglycan/LPS O-acetylase OafA/YrhL